MTEEEPPQYNCVLVEDVAPPHKMYVWLEEFYNPEDETMRLVARGTHDNLRVIRKIRQGVEHAN